MAWQILYDSGDLTGLAEGAAIPTYGGLTPAQLVAGTAEYAISAKNDAGTVVGPMGLRRVSTALRLCNPLLIPTSDNWSKHRVTIYGQLGDSPGAASFNTTSNLLGVARALTGNQWMMTGGILYLDGGSNGQSRIQVANSGGYGTPQIGQAGVALSTPYKLVFTETGNASPYPAQLDCYSGGPAYTTPVFTGATGDATGFTSNLATTSNLTGVMITSSAFPKASVITRFVVEYDDTTSTLTAMTIGVISAASGTGSVTLSTSANAAGGNGGPYTYNIYRSTDPTFVATLGVTTPLASVSSLPYTDSTVAAGVVYYYRVIATDGVGGHSIIGEPLPGIAAGVPQVIPGISTYARSYNTTSAPTAASLAIVCYGDSITFGAQTTVPGDADPVAGVTPVSQMGKQLLTKAGVSNVYLANKGTSGLQSTDPGTNSTYYTPAKTAMQTLLAAHPSAVPVLNIMFGTNDSSSGTRASTSTFITNITNTITQWLTDFPTSKVQVNAMPYYSPNTISANNYDEAGLLLMQGYAAALPAMVASFAAAHPGQVFLGDTYYYPYSAMNYTTIMAAQAGGTNGSTFYLHPNNAGSATLGQYWADALYANLYAVPASINVSPSTASGSTTFTAAVLPVAASQGVTWSASAGSINASGVFTAPPATGSIQTITITARSTANAAITGTATVTIAASAVTRTGLAATVIAAIAGLTSTGLVGQLIAGNFGNVRADGGGRYTILALDNATPLAIVSANANPDGSLTVLNVAPAPSV